MSVQVTINEIRSASRFLDEELVLQSNPRLQISLWQ